MTERDKLIEDNLKLVHSCCHRFTNRGIDYEELYSAGCLGLVKASKGFDRSRGFNFSTYAVPVILGEIKRLFRDGGTIKVSRSIKELSVKALREKDFLQRKLVREPTVSEIAQRLDVSAEEVTEALTSSLPVFSLTYEDDDGVQEFDLSDENDEEKIVGTIALNEVVTSLDEQDRKLIILRYYNEKTQVQTAKELGMTQVQVSRRERAILGEMRKRLG